MRFIDPSTYVSSWTNSTTTPLTITGAQSTVNANGYTLYTFTTTGKSPVTIRGRGNADILFVAGGGGGVGLGGGGGAGGYIYRQNVLIQGGTESNPVAPDNFIQVGAGGHGPLNNSHGPIGGAGSPSKLVIDGATVIEAIGGGAGGSYSGVAADFQQTGSVLGSYIVDGAPVGNNLYLGNHTPLSLNPANPLPGQYGPGHNGGRGGSGGGGAANGNPPGGSGVMGQGHPGGHGHHPNHHKGGGGGGAGSAGGNTNPGWPGSRQHSGGPGGDGLASDITGTNLHYAGGGGAGMHWSGWVHAGGGSRGGGPTGGNHSPDHGNRALPTGARANTGAGGGGGNNPEAQGRGGPGIVVIRIKNDQQPVPAAVRKFTNGTSV
jgi:hypothetical protein